jgi:hypothetical protein
MLLPDESQRCYPPITGCRRHEKSKEWPGRPAKSNMHWISSSASGDAMGIRAMFQRRRVRTAFGEYLSPEVIRRLLQNPNLVSPQVKHYQYVVVLADDSNLQEIQPMISKITEIFVQHHATISVVSSSLFVALLGVPFNDCNSPEARRKLVDALLQELGGRIRIGHGEADSLVGNLGGPLRYSYGAVIPGFSGVLKKLLDTNFGTAVEIS